MHEAGQWGVVEYGHLGGYVPGGDPDTTYPYLWRWLVEGFGVRSVLDIGCGDGAAVDAFRDLGVPHVVGIDGVPQNHPCIITHDYETGSVYESASFDLGWMAEFVEHVEPRFVPNFVHDLKFCRTVLMTHAQPEQAGWHHVNCQPAAYWEGVMEAAGFELDSALTESTRSLAHGYYAQTGMAFRNMDLA